jgi:glycosyltransferase involved in cell wall biosynthesis
VAHTTAPITVCIGTYGDRTHWSTLAHERAMPSVDRQTIRPANLLWSHGPDLHTARNTAAEAARSDWLCFLDADDELDPFYLEAMTAATAKLASGDHLLQPATLGIHPDGHEDPEATLIPPKPLLDGNYLVIGTLLRRAQFQRVGGFWNWPIYEDWDLWLRCRRDGATILPVADAIYRVHVNTNGRNSNDRATQLATYHRIRAQHSSHAP